jgi:glycosyltransferase involved in cell wall biosynthesis
MHNDIETKLFDSPCKDRIRFVGYEPDTALYHAGSDVYALTSREDPFPNVVLESFDAGVPVVAFSSTGGAASLVEGVGGITVPLQNVTEFSAALCRLLDSPDLSAGLGKAAQDHVDRHFAFRSYLVALCGLLGVNLSKCE